MILKILHENKDGSNSTWNYFEAREIRRYKDPIVIENEKNLKQWCAGSEICLTKDQIATPEKIEYPYSFFWLHFYDEDNISKNIMFDNIVYLLNNKGENIERIN